MPESYSDLNKHSITFFSFELEFLLIAEVHFFGEVRLTVAAPNSEVPLLVFGEGELLDVVRRTKYDQIEDSHNNNTT